jgi:hypothetical protein
MRRFVYCPGCWKAAPSSRDLTGMGCEGQHRPAIDAEDVEPLIEAAREALSLFEGQPEHRAAEALIAALLPFEEGK